MIWKLNYSTKVKIYSPQGYRVSQVLLLQGKFWKIHYRCKTKGYLKMLFLFFKIVFIDFRRRRREGRWRERDTNTKERETLIGCLLPGMEPENPGMCPQWKSNWKLLSAWDDAQLSHTDRAMLFLLPETLFFHTSIAILPDPISSHLISTSLSGLNIIFLPEGIFWPQILS